MTPAYYLNMSKILTVLASLTILSGTVFGDEPSSSAPTNIRLTFENATPEVVNEAQQIIGKAAQLFEKVTNEPVGKLPVQIRFVEQVHFGDMIRSQSGRVQGATLYQNDVCVIEISQRRTSTWQRILAHEVIHVFVREAYGKTSNKTLNEGLAEYLAEQMFPSEVRRDLRNASFGRCAAALRPYVEGHRFCHDHASDGEFSNFLATQLKKPDGSYRSLKQAWEKNCCDKEERILAHDP